MTVLLTLLLTIYYFGLLITLISSLKKRIQASSKLSGRDFYIYSLSVNIEKNIFRYKLLSVLQIISISVLWPFYIIIMLFHFFYSRPSNITKLGASTSLFPLKESSLILSSITISLLIFLNANTKTHSIYLYPVVISFLISSTISLILYLPKYKSDFLNVSFDLISNLNKSLFNTLITTLVLSFTLIFSVIQSYSFLIDPAKVNIHATLEIFKSLFIQKTIAEWLLGDIKHISFLDIIISLNGLFITISIISSIKKLFGNRTTDQDWAYILSSLLVLEKPAYAYKLSKSNNLLKKKGILSFINANIFLSHGYMNEAINSMKSFFNQINDPYVADATFILLVKILGFFPLPKYSVSLLWDSICKIELNSFTISYIKNELEKFKIDNLSNKARIIKSEESSSFSEMINEYNEANTQESKYLAIKKMKTHSKTQQMFKSYYLINTIPTPKSITKKENDLQKIEFQRRISEEINALKNFTNDETLLKSEIYFLGIVLSHINSYTKENNKEINQTFQTLVDDFINYAKSAELGSMRIMFDHVLFQTFSVNK